MEDLIVVKVRDQHPLTVKPDLLTANSPVFDKLINELSQHEIELEDFDTETVVLFMTLLDSKERRIKVIESKHFRELHKLTVIFEVDWMMEECHRHLMEKLDLRKLIERYGCYRSYTYSYGGELDFGTAIREYGWCWKSSIFVWEECKFMTKKWGNRFMGFVNMFVDSVRILEGTEVDWKEEDGRYETHEFNRRFVQEFVKGVDNFIPLEMDVLLRISPIAQLDIILESLVKLLQDHHSLTNGLKYLLQNLNLPLCRINVPLLYDTVLDALAAKSDTLPLEDVKLMFNIMKDASRLPQPKEIKSVYDIKSFEWIRDGVFQESTDKILYVAEHEYVNSMNTIVDYILHVMFTFQDEELPDIDADDIVTRLEEIYLQGGLRKAHRQYIEGALNSLECLRRQKNSEIDCHKCELASDWHVDYSSSTLKCGRCQNTARHYNFDPVRLQYLKILQLIKKNNDLSSTWDNLMVYLYYREEMYEGEILKFHFKHPAVPHCSRSGKCGFFLKIGKYTSSLTGKEATFVKLHRDDTWSSKQSKDRIHCHDVISPDDINLMYTSFSYNNRSLSECCVPSALFDQYLSNRHPIVNIDNYNKLALYNVTNYLVKKNDSSNY